MTKPNNNNRKENRHKNQIESPEKNPIINE